jgi:hypothetical protein
VETPEDHYFIWAEYVEDRVWKPLEKNSADLPVHDGAALPVMFNGAEGRIHSRQELAI